MRILGHIHTFNDENVIERCLGALLAQTRPADAILIVDNGSTDGTLDRDFPPEVTVVRNGHNMGTSGAVHIGLKYAMENGFDWALILDADCALRPDALEKLVALWESLSPDVQAKIWRLSSLPMELPEKAVSVPFSVSLAFYEGNQTPRPRHGVVFSDRGYARVVPEAGASHYACDATIWSGCMFRLDAVREVGLPPMDYVLDWGEYEYGYRGKRKGFKALMSQESLLDHNIRGHASFQFTRYGIGPFAFQLIEMPPIRCYYVIRNTLYFWLFEFHGPSLRAALPRIFKMVFLTLNFAVRPISHREHFKACLRGFRDGLAKRMDRRYP